MKKITELKNHSWEVEMNNVIQMEKKAQRGNNLKFGAFILLVLMAVSFVVTYSLVAVPNFVNHFIGG